MIANPGIYYRRRRRTAAEIDASWLEAIGENGGHLTWESSPHVMWLATRPDVVAQFKEKQSEH